MLTGHQEMLCNLSSQIIPDMPVKLTTPGLGRREAGGAKAHGLGGPQKDHQREEERGERGTKDKVIIGYHEPGAHSQKLCTL